MSEIPQHGGLVHVNSLGVAACARGCWRGVPFRCDGELVTFCPVCERDAHAAALAALKPHAGTARNAPCPCDSGRKYKKCCGR